MPDPVEDYGEAPGLGILPNGNIMVVVDPDEDAVEMTPEEVKKMFPGEEP